MNGPSAYQLDVLAQAVRGVAESDVAAYQDLKRLFAEKDDAGRGEFRRAFERYYGLYAGGVTQAWRDRYFELLFGLTLTEGADPYTPLLWSLYAIPRHKGDCALQFSFVSKLVAMHDERYPLYDRYVSGFFGIAPPAIGGLSFRIAGFVAHMQWLRQTYAAWAQDAAFQQVIASLRDRYPCLQSVAVPRLADMLVWAAGKSGLECQPETEQRA